MIFEKQIVNGYRKMAYTRCDDTGCVFYFTHRDFPGLSCEEYPFPSSMGHTLEGYLYAYPDAREGRLVVFDHGFGGGHTAYMKEIELLCRHGYTVFAYDHTGCMQSGGADTNGMAQSLHDLDDCIRALRNDDRFASAELSVVGHSWGGFSTLNISVIHKDISHVVVLAGFVSVRLLIESFFPGILRGYRDAVMKVERAANPDYIDFDARESLKGCDTKALLIYSDNDKRCTKSAHYDALYEALSEKDGIRFILEHNKGHNPNYTERAVSYLDRFFAELTRKTRKKLLKTPEDKASFVASYDWDLMTEQDERVWSKIFDFLDN